jgi:ADP-ribosylglycohydrolase
MQMDQIDLNQDKVKGIIAGISIGDSLGAAHEFNYKRKYTGKVQPYEFRTQWQGTTHFPAGYITDDSNMSIALFRTIKANNGTYDVDKVIFAYLMWANGYPLSGYKDQKQLRPPFMGRNNRKILGSAKTLRGYYAKRKKLTENGEMNSQSNGSMMRAAPLALLDNWEEAAKIDASITNPNQINIDCNIIYVGMVKGFLSNKDFDVVQLLKARVNNESYDKTVIETVEFALNKDLAGFLELTDQKNFSDKKTKGWVVNMLYLAIRCILDFDNYDDAMRNIITNSEYGGSGSDSDTICAIVGALFGAKYGFNQITSSSDMTYNWEAVRTHHKLDLERPVHIDYTLDGLDLLLEFIS